MASISSRASLTSDSSPFNSKSVFTNPRFSSPLSQKSTVIPIPPSISRLSNPASICCCSRSDNPAADDAGKWDFSIAEVVRNWIKKFGGFVSNFENDSSNNKNKALVVDDVDDDDWDWDRWKKHFDEMDEQQSVVSILKSQLTHAVNREEYEDAARLKVAIAAATTNDTVGRVMSYLNTAIEEENYEDAAFLRDYASAGLVGWWAGISEDGKDPYGKIIHISAEHGRYVARSYSPRQLAAGRSGAPLFEIYLTMSKNGDYKEQAVYLKRRVVAQDSPTVSSKSFSPTVNNLNPLNPTTDKVDLVKKAFEDKEGDDESDISEGSDFENILQTMIPGVKVKVMKVIEPGKVDRDLISNLVEQIVEEEDEDKDTVEDEDEGTEEVDEDKDTEEEDENEDYELESSDTENDIKGMHGEEQNEIVIDSSTGFTDEQSQISVKVVVGCFVQEASGSSRKDLLRVPAKLDKKGRLSFCFTVDEDDNEQVSGGAVDPLLNKLQKHRSIDHVMLDLVKSIQKGKIPMKVLEDIGNLLTLTLSQAQKREPLSGSTTFNRIDISASSDPLNGIYIGAHGLYTSEIIQIKRKFGQWQEDSGKDKSLDLEFYEYIEAVKLTGDPYVPAGQIAFRAKVGKRYQLPQRGTIPEEFGVVARYKGQGRLADPGFQNPRWVDGEVVILDGKYIKSGPVVGFVYWAPEFHFLVFFNQLRLRN